LKDELDADRIGFRAINIDEPEQAHYVQDFQLTMRTVVLVAEVAGKVVRWKRLDECWDRFDDPEDYTDYLRRSLGRFRDEPAVAP